MRGAEVEVRLTADTQLYFARERGAPALPTNPDDLLVSGRVVGVACTEISGQLVATGIMPHVDADQDEADEGFA
jgi:hypothetical protein